MSGEQLAGLLLGKKALVLQRHEGAVAEVALGHPGDGVNVAQAAGAFLDVGLQLVGGVVKLGVARLLLGLLAGEELGHRPQDVGRQCRLQLSRQDLVAAEGARLQQGGDDGDVFTGFVDALVERAHALADLQANVPAEGGEPLKRAAVPLQGVPLVQQHDVDVGVRQQLTAAVAAHRQHGQAGGLIRKMQGPGRAQAFVDQVGAGVHQRFGTAAVVKHGEQAVATPVQRLAKGIDRVLALGQTGPYLGW